MLLLDVHGHGLFSVQQRLQRWARFYRCSTR